MLLWVILAALTALVLAVLLRPLAASKREPAAQGFDAAVYRDQLAEVESDRARGLIGEEEAEAARIEISRRLLAADGKARAAGGDKTGGSGAKAAMVGIALALPMLAVGVYLLYGAPRLPDQPLAARLQDPANEQNLAALVAKVEARLREHPEEGEGHIPDQQQLEGGGAGEGEGADGPATGEAAESGEEDHERHDDGDDAAQEPAAGELVAAQAPAKPENGADLPGIHAPSSSQLRRWRS